MNKWKAPAGRRDDGPTEKLQEEVRKIQREVEELRAMIEEMKKQKTAVLRCKRLSPYAQLPTRGSDGSAGLDLYSTESLTLYPGDIRPVHTGLAMEIPEGCWGALATRSGHGKIGVRLSAGMNVDDEDYRGEVIAFMSNDGEYPFEVRTGDRICQVVIGEWVRCEPAWAGELTKTKRGTGGFGSTGR